MRNCPHCGKEIQDEAAFCRFCRRDVEPPLWLTSLQKCPYCAEWVERGIERCPLCGKALITEEPFITSDEADSTEILLKEVRDNIFSKGATADEEDAQEEAPAEPPFHTVPREESEYKESSSDPFESQEGLGVLRERQRAEIPFKPVAPIESQESDAGPERGRPGIPIRRMLTLFVLLIATVALVGGAVYAYQQLGPLNALGLLGNSQQATATLLSPTDAPTQTEPTSTYVAATLPPLATPTGMAGECILWSEITGEMEGQFVCAYGEIKRRWRIDSEIPYIAIFSEELGTFAIADRTTFYTQFQPGDCIQIEGEIELMRGSRPFIDAQGDLSTCPLEP